MAQDFINPYLEYISMFMESPKVAENISDLIDCLTINDILSKIPEFPQGKIQQAPFTFAHIFSNLKQTYRRIEQFWNENLDRELECREIDLVDVAHNSNQKEFTKIIDIVIQSGVLSSQRDLFIKKMMETSLSTQEYFVRIVQQTLDERKTFSPRKRKQQRLYDKLVELDHENENLQNVISQICQEKYDIQMRYRLLFEKISQKDSEILKLSGETTGIFTTPQRKRAYGSYDSVQKNNEFIERLKAKIIQISKDHQKQILALNQKIECYNLKINRIEEYENQIDLYKVKLLSNEQTLKQFEEISQKYVQLKVTLVEKDQIIAEQFRKINKKNELIRQLQEAMMDKNIEIGRKNVRIQQFSKLSTSSSSLLEDSLLRITPIPLQKSISECSCEDLTQKIENFHEINNNLREELTKAQENSKNLEKQVRRLKKLASDQQLKNKKMGEFIEQNLQKYMGDTNFCIDSLKMYTRDKTIRTKLRQTIQTAGNMSSRLGRSRHKDKQNQFHYDNQELEQSSIYSANKSRRSSKKKSEGLRQTNRFHNL